ncbi:MAG: ANTAR domain-containing protein [Clostridia bacterium]|nr:ANTAR domain-containing protein [Clostridia bacterium]
MEKQIACRFLAAAPECAKARIEEILYAIGFTPDGICTSGEDILAQAAGEHVLLLTTYQLPDMTGMELAERLGDQADAMIIVPADYDESEASGCDALLLRNPLSQDALYQAIRATLFMQKKLVASRAKAEKLSRMLEERKVIDKAKGRLMDELHMTEKQAHYHIQKKSMDMGRRIADIALEILNAEELTGEA